MFDRHAPHDARTNLFAGRGVVRVWNLAPTPMAPFSALLACELEPGGSVGAHVQQRDPEALIVLAGHGEALVGARAEALAPGVVVFLAHGQSLAIENGSTSEPLRYVIVKVRAD